MEDILLRYQRDFNDSDLSLNDELIMDSMISEIERLRLRVTELEGEQLENMTETERLRNIGNELIDKICDSCRIINPQHEGCTYCEEKYNFDQALKE